MTKKEMVEKLMRKAYELSQEYSWDGYDELCTMCYDWNAAHEDEEIFMCDHENEETGLVDGLCIEYDYWVFE